MIPGPAPAYWTGRNLAEICELDPGAQRVPNQHGVTLIVSTVDGTRELPVGSLVYHDSEDAVRAISRLDIDMGLYRLSRALDG